MTRPIRFIPVLMMATYLSGCTMIPTLDSLTYGESPQWSDIPGYEISTQDGVVADLSWDTFFESAEIREVIQTALDNNKDLKTSALNIDKARALYRIERSDLYPSLDANGSGAVAKSSDESSPTGKAAKTESYQANIGITAYELDLFGRIQSQNESALNEYLATEQAFAVVRQSLIAEVANAYLQYLADVKLLDLTKQTLETQKKTYNLIKVSMDNGIATELDLAGSQTTVETARANYHYYQRLVEQDKNALYLLMGIAHDESKIPQTSLDKVVIKADLDPGIPSQVLLKRPDVKQAEFNLLSANANIGAARAAFFPRISLTGAFGFASQDLSDLFASGAAGAWSFTPQLTLPIFNAGSNQANLDIAKIEKEQSVIAYEQAIQTAFREVSDELIARATLSKQLKAQGDLVQSAQKVYDITYARYKSGIDDFLDVLDAQRELYAYQQNEIEIERQRLTNLVDMYKVLGGE